MKNKLVKLLLTLTIIFSCLTGCTQKKKATITTTVYPVKYLVEQLAGDLVDIQYLSSDEFIQRASIADNYDEILKNTDLLIYIGELEPYMDMYSSEIQEYGLQVINLASLSAIDNFSRYTTTVVNNVKVVVESLYYESDLFENVDVYSKDPFIWMDPIGMSSMASTIKEWLQEKYPESSLVIENNFKSLQADFVRLDAEYQALNNYEDIKIVSIAASFGLWQKTYGVEVYPVVLSKYGALPSDEQLAEIEKVIKENEVKYIAYDNTLPEDMQQLYEKVKEDLGLTPINLSSLSKIAESDIEKNKTYKTIMYENLTALEKVFKTVKSSQ